MNNWEYDWYYFKTSNDNYMNFAYDISVSSSNDYYTGSLVYNFELNEAPLEEEKPKQKGFSVLSRKEINLDDS